ncbi:MAG: hypothetical protein JW745_05390 [Sedimentisphaerales bacterium]|nr:hypothetical protein [Sedimentisphaerales bacterium]
MKDLYSDLELIAGTRENWQEFANWHYRSDRLWFADRIFMFRHKSGTTAAIVIYSFAHANNRIRSTALSQLKYMQIPNCQNLRMINHDFRTISRVVVRPEFRGIALGSELIKRTMPLLDVRFIEAIAVMANFSQLFCRAGMQVYNQQPNKHIINARKFMLKYQLDDNLPTTTLINNILTREPEEQNSIVRYLYNFCCHYKRSLRSREPDITMLSDYLDIIRFQLATAPAYYLYDKAGAITVKQHTKS